MPTIAGLGSRCTFGGPLRKAEAAINQYFNKPTAPNSRTASEMHVFLHSRTSTLKP